MTAFGLALLKLALGGLKGIWRLLQWLWSVKLPALFTVAAAVFALIQMGEARHQTKRADNAEVGWKLEKKGRLADRAAVAAAQKAATDRAKAEKAATEARYTQIQKDNTHALTLARADAAARLSDWMRTHRADQGGAQRASVPDAPGAASGPDADAGAAFLVGPDDLASCTAAYVTATGWQKWWADIQATQGGK